MRKKGQRWTKYGIQYERLCERSYYWFSVTVIVEFFWWIKKNKLWHGIQQLLFCFSQNAQRILAPGFHPVFWAVPVVFWLKCFCVFAQRHYLYDSEVFISKSFFPTFLVVEVRFVITEANEYQQKIMDTHFKYVSQSQSIICHVVTQYEWQLSCPYYSPTLFCLPL